MSDCPKRDRLSDTVVLFALPILAYLLTYLYELGYCSVFDIPWAFVSINPTSVIEGLGMILMSALGSSLIGGMYLLALVTLGFVLVGLIDRRFLKLKQLFWDKIGQLRITSGRNLRSVFLGLLIICAWYLFRVPFGTLLVVVVIVIWAIGGAIYIPKMIRELTSEILGRQAARRDDEGILEKVARELGFNVVDLILSFVFLVVLSWGSGYYFANAQKEFLVPVDSPNAVVLKIYGDKVITAPFNRSTKVIEPQFKIRKPDSSELRLEDNVGPLHLKGK